jgi:hypothetical protein
LRVVRPAGTGTYRVRGIAVAEAGGDWGQLALFFTDRVAPLLARTPGQVNAVGVLAQSGVSADLSGARLAAKRGLGFTVLDRRPAAHADAGDPRRQVQRMIAGEALVLAAIGGAAGCLTGLALAT